MSRKQELYLKIFERVLPRLRTTERWSIVQRLRYRYSLRYEAELIHNLPPCLVELGYTQRDIYWLNVQARSYVFGEPTHKKKLYESLRPTITDILLDVPDDLFPKWNGGRVPNPPVVREYCGYENDTTGAVCGGVEPE